MEMLCICTFGNFGKIKGLTLGKVYNVKYSADNKLLIINDGLKPQLVRADNFVSNEAMKRLSCIPKFT